MQLRAGVLGAILILILSGCVAHSPAVERLEIEREAASLAAGPIVPFAPPRLAGEFIDVSPLDPQRPARYLVSIGKPRVRGDLDARRLERFVRHQQDTLARCAAWGPGVVDIQYVIGGTRIVAIRESTSASPAATACVVRAISNWTNPPKPSSSRVGVSQRFELRVE